MADNQGPLVIGISILTLALGGLFIFARVIVRTILKPQFGFDDALIILTWFIVLGFNVSYFVAVSHGFGRHYTELSPQDLVAAARAGVIGEFFAVFAYPSGKAAVAYLLIRVFPSRKLHAFLWSFVAANAVLFYLNGVFFLVQCTPTAYQWDREIVGGHCWDPKVLVDWGYLTGVVGALTDLVFAVVPWFYIVRLNMPTARKIVIGIALSMGLFPFVCSILKIYYTSTIAANADPTYKPVPLVLTSAAELCAINIAACVPTLRPFYLWLTGRDPKGTEKTAAYTEQGRSGYESKRLGFFTRRSDTRAQLESMDNYERHILQLRTYDVSVETRGDKRSEDTKEESTTHTTIDAGVSD